MKFTSISDNQLFGYLLFAFVAMAGFAYVNFLPGLVNALIETKGFSATEAGQVIAFNGYGGLAGTVTAIFALHKASWKKVMLISLAVLCLFDLMCIWTEQYALILSCRFISGVFGGLAVGTAFSVLARLKSPDRAFGCMLFLQFISGSLVIFCLPALESHFSTYAVFWVMAGISVMCFLIIPLLPEPPLTLAVKQNRTPHSVSKVKATLLMMAIMGYLCAANAIWTYVQLIGEQSGLSHEQASAYVAATGLLGLIGALIPVLFVKREGRMMWIFLGIGLSVGAAVLLNLSPLSSGVYILALAMLFLSWPAVNAYLLAVTSDLDPKGSLPVIAAVISQLGLASGPLMASGLIASDSYSLMLTTCASLFVLSLLCAARPAFSNQQSASNP